MQPRMYLFKHCACIHVVVLFIYVDILHFLLHYSSKPQQNGQQILHSTAILNNGDTSYWE